MSDAELMGNSILDQPETIGYLKSLGLDYGWGPTAVVEWTLEHIHVLTGTPWWASIILTALFFRLAFLYTFMSAADNAARMKAIQPIIKPLMQKSQAAQFSGNTAAVMQLRNEMKIINKRAGVSLWKGFVPMLTGFTGYGSFVLLRAMSNLPVPGIETGGILWFHNLAVTDPFLILPVATSFTMYSLFKVRCRHVV